MASKISLIKKAIIKHFNSVHGDIPIWFEDMALESRPDMGVWMELRVVGPSECRLSKNLVKSEVTVDILLQSVEDGYIHDIYAIDRYVEDVVNMFTCIEVLNPDDSVLTVLQLIREGDFTVNVITIPVGPNEPRQIREIYGTYQCQYVG